MSWMLAAFFICGASAFTSCSNNDDNPVVDNSLAEKIVGKWIHADTDGETVTTDMKSVYTFTKNGSALKGFYSMSMTESGVWAYWQETDTAVFRNTFYKYKEYTYYNFRPDSLSPMRGIGDSIVALPYPTDREGVSREFIRPDAGCYQYRP